MTAERTSYAVTPGVGAVFFTPDQFRLVAEAAGPGGRVELNSFMQLIVHTPEGDVAAQQDRLRAAGLGVYPVGPVVKNLHTCTFCMGERVDGLPDARRLDAAVAAQPVPFPVRIGFSGCPNNCGEALLRDIGVVRTAEGRYDIYAGGRASGLVPHPGEAVAWGVAGTELVAVVAAILAEYRRTAKGRERLWKNLQRIGPEPYREIARSALAP